MCGNSSVESRYQHTVTKMQSQLEATGTTMQGLEAVANDNNNSVSFVYLFKTTVN